MKNTTVKIIVVFAIFVVFFIAYSKRDYISAFVNGILGTGHTKMFKINGNDIGPYLQGDTVIAENSTFEKRNPAVGDVVVYKSTVNNTKIDTIGTVAGIPGSSVSGVMAPSNFYLIRKDNKIEVIPRADITWLVIRKAV